MLSTRALAAAIGCGIAGGAALGALAWYASRPADIRIALDPPRRSAEVVVAIRPADPAPPRAPDPAPRRMVTVPIITERVVALGPPRTPATLIDWTQRPLPDAGLIRLGDLAIARSLVLAAGAAQVSDATSDRTYVAPTLTARESAVADRVLAALRAEAVAMTIAAAPTDLLEIPDRPVVAELQQGDDPVLISDAIERADTDTVTLPSPVLAARFDPLIERAATRVVSVAEVDPTDAGLVTLSVLSPRVDAAAVLLASADGLATSGATSLLALAAVAPAGAQHLPTPEQMFAAAFDTDGVVDGAGEARGLGALPPRAPPLRLAQPALDTTPELSTAPRRRPVMLASVDSADGLRRLLDQHELAIRPGAVLPDLFLHRLPGDIAAIRQAEERKAVFMRTLLPLVLKVNETWLARRQRVDALAPLMAIGAPLHPVDQADLDDLLRDIRMDRWHHEEVLRRLDAIPPSLALAQAAEESGWGTSNAARTLNALFGEMVARGPEAGQIRRFEDLSSTVAAYIRNLNTHPAYAEMRRRRAQLRALGEPIDGPALIPFLLRYSERGPDYIATIQTIIRINNLTQYDDVRLTASPLVASAP